MSRRASQHGFDLWFCPSRFIRSWELRVLPLESVTFLGRSGKSQVLSLAAAVVSRDLFPPSVSLKGLSDLLCFDWQRKHRANVTCCKYKKKSSPTTVRYHVWKSYLVPWTHTRWLISVAICSTKHQFQYIIFIPRVEFCVLHAHLSYVNENEQRRCLR